MARKQQKKSGEPLVTSVASVVRRTVDTRPFTVDEIHAQKREMYEILRDALEVFTKNLKDGNVDLTSSLDLDRIVKNMMLVMGEPDGVPQSDETKTVVTFAEPLSLDDPDVQSVYRRLTESYNEQNDDRSSGEA